MQLRCLSAGQEILAVSQARDACGKRVAAGPASQCLTHRGRVERAGTGENPCRSPVVYSRGRVATSRALNGSPSGGIQRIVDGSVTARHLDGCCRVPRISARIVPDMSPSHARAWTWSSPRPRRSARQRAIRRRSCARLAGRIRSQLFFRRPSRPD